MRCADWIFKTLADKGAKHVFLVTGGGAMFLNDALRCEKRLTPVCCHHEQGAAIAAEGYARITGKPAVVSVTTGPGGTNALTGVIGEWLDSVPVLYISGQVKKITTIRSCPELALRQLGDQEINIVDIVRPVTKYAAFVDDPKSISRELETALWHATNGRPGPVWLDVPIDVQSAEVSEADLEPFVPPETAVPEPDAAAVEYAASSFLRAKSPVVIAGQGIRIAGAQQAFLELADRMNVPILATFEGFDLIPTGDPRMIGRIGTIGTRAGNIALQNADWVLCLGSRNNIRQISYNFENYVKDARDFICVDVDRAELDKPTVRPTLKIHADAARFIARFGAELGGLPPRPEHEKWLAWCRERTARYPVVAEHRAPVASGIDPYVFTELLTEALPENAIVGCANATPSLALFQAGVVKPGQRMICNSGCAAMGFGLPAALGCAVAAADSGRQVVCLDGDGSLMMNLQELQTVAANRLPLKLFMYDNGEYCSIRQTHDNFFGARIGCDAASGVTFPDWRRIAEAFAWEYAVVDSEESARRIVPEVLAAKKPFFCDVKLAPGYVFAPKLSSRKLPDGKLVSPSLEDMFPFLPEDEMRGNRYGN